MNSAREPKSTPAPPPSPAAHHHASHRRLLRDPGAPGDLAGIDAIVVPTARPSQYLRHASHLAQTLRCPLVVLCSGRWTSAARVRAGAAPGADVLAIDFTGASAARLPALETSTVLPPRLRRNADTAAKRNFALALARMVGWRRIAFLDDDIEVRAPDDLRRAAGLLDRFDAAGLSIGGFPDNSVVCHAYRAVGGDQDSFVGGGALVVETVRNVAFFPNIYNEDWFYLLKEDGLRPLAVTGQVRQAPYDPFRTTERARSEEMGDVLAEGVFWLLDEGGSVRDADLRHWTAFLARRRRFIEAILDHLPHVPVRPDERRRMEESLKAARGRLALIRPELCLAYLDTWRADGKVWRDFVELLPSGVSFGDALRYLADAGQGRGGLRRPGPTLT
ncbi:hypothetical protein ACQEUU_18880 [Nonomuraea sp. CA-218870]|uniref:hypothetical protein n=1 Tax=Nonomuraea sp. CA-218870 TaxID=3239998 RepID=UPI003D921D69